MEFDIDVSGEDPLNKDYVVCIASRDGKIIKGYKITKEISKILNENFKKREYNRYKRSQQGKANLKLRLYCIIIYYVFKELKIKGPVSLNICRDFNGREKDIKKQLKDLLVNKLKLDINDQFYFVKLSSESLAHEYAYLMKKDVKNQLPNYIKIKLIDIEKWLKK